MAMQLPLGGRSLGTDFDDKYTKASGKKEDMQSGPLEKYREALQVVDGLGTRGSFTAYTCFLAVGAAVYCYLGGDITTAGTQVLRYMEAISEAFGLLYLRRKIGSTCSVSGISGMTIIMYVLVYSLRCVVFIPYGFRKEELDNWAVWVLVCTSLVIVLDVFRSVFRTHRKTYQDDLDVLNIKYLVPICLVLALVMHPQFHVRLLMGPIYTYIWTACLYLDVLALMPQVVMMGKSGGKIESPICHFVAATAVSRMVDIWFWFYNFDSVGPPDLQRGDINFSACLIVALHVLHLLLVADFMYYYVKARFAGSLSDDLSVEDLPVSVEDILEDICI